MGGAFHQRMGGASFSQRKHLINLWPGLARVEQRPDFRPQLRRDLALLRRAARPHGAAGQGQATGHDRGKVELRHLSPLQEGDLYQPSIDRERANVTLEIGRANHVEHHINAAPIGEALDLITEISCPVVDRGRGTQAHAGCNLVVRSGGRIGGRSQGRGQLDRGNPNAGCAAMDQHGFTRHQPPHHEQIGPDGEIGFRHRRSPQRVVATRPR